MLTPKINAEKRSISLVLNKGISSGLWLPLMLPSTGRVVQSAWCRTAGLSGLRRSTESGGRSQVLIYLCHHLNTVFYTVNSWLPVRLAGTGICCCLILQIICVIAENEQSLTNKYIQTNVFSPKSFKRPTSYKVNTKLNFFYCTYS